MNMQDVTDRIMHLREMTRHVWNTYFRALGRDVEWDDADDLVDMMRIAFRAAFDMKRREEPDLFRKPLLWLQVRPPADGSTVAVLVNREAGLTHGSFTHDVRDVTFPGSTLLFVELFDFDILGFRNLPYIMVFISQCERRPDVEGHYALVPLDARLVSVVSSLDNEAEGEQKG